MKTRFADGNVLCKRIHINQSINQSINPTCRFL